MVKFIFCEDPLIRNTPDQAYRAEAEALEALGQSCALINYEILTGGSNPLDAMRRVAVESKPQLGIYRGWMLKPDRYKIMYDALLARGIQLINDPIAYRHCHYLPESYPIIVSHTPKTTWRYQAEGLAAPDLEALFRPFGSKPVVIKDFVKSQKHYWFDACYIPSAADAANVQRVVNRFLELQGDDLNEGLVVREFIEFEPLAAHSKSQMPLTREYRVFVLNGEPLVTSEYWEEGEYDELPPMLDDFERVYTRVKSRFFTMDIARQKGGPWMIVELGDAQVAGLPERLDVQSFYKSLCATLIKS